MFHAGDARRRFSLDALGRVTKASPSMETRTRTAGTSYSRESKTSFSDYFVLINVLPKRARKLFATKKAERMVLMALICCQRWGCCWLQTRQQEVFWRLGLSQYAATLKLFVHMSKSSLGPDAIIARWCF